MNRQMISCLLEQIKKIKPKHNDKTIVYLSGGEPLLHPEFESILEMVCSQNYIDQVHVLSNGTLVHKWLDTFLKYQSKLGIQVSVDGDQQINDDIRGQGTYAKACDALHTLNSLEIPHWISYTVSKTNMHCFKDILALALNTHSINNNVTPYTGEIQQMLSYEEWKEFKYDFIKYAADFGLKNPHGTHACGFTYQCGANANGITINPDGTITGCARDNRVKGDYENIEKIITSEEQLMNETCMRSAWGSINNFSLKIRLE